MTLPKQTITVDGLGRPMSAYKDDNPVNLSAMGNQSIRRFSEVLFDDASQRFYLIFREAAPDKYRDKHPTAAMHLAAHEGTEAPENAVIRGVAQPCYPTYAAGVEAEQAILNWMMLRGDFA